MSAKIARMSKNLWDDETETAGTINADGTTTTDRDYVRNTKPILLDERETVGLYTDYATGHWIVAYNNENTIIERRQLSSIPVTQTVYTAPSACKYIHPFFGMRTASATNITKIGVTYGGVLPYEPYGMIWEDCAVKVRQNGAWVDTTEEVRQNGTWEQQTTPTLSQQSLSPQMSLDVQPIQPELQPMGEISENEEV